MKKILIFGNSGSGKSTMAKQLSESKGLAHLDLDTIAWLAETPPKRRPIEEAQKEITAFTHKHNEWVIEGCYADLLSLVTHEANEAIFMNLPVELCIANAKSRPWESHKYESKTAQDANLPMLIEWISQYVNREDTFSKVAHEALFANFLGKKTIHKENP